jgi:hypothetical protein
MSRLLEEKCVYGTGNVPKCTGIPDGFLDSGRQSVNVFEIYCVKTIILLSSYMMYLSIGVMLRGASTMVVTNFAEPDQDDSRDVD